MYRFIAAVPGFFAVCFAVLLFILPTAIEAQDTYPAKHNRDTLIAAAGNLMKSAGYCALVTLDENGFPNVRTMHPFEPEKDMTVWLGTNSNSRKVNEIKNNPRVALYYFLSNASGYVVLKGIATLTDDPAMTGKYWKEKWEDYYEDQKKNYMLIKVVPDKIEVVDYNSGITGDSDTWAVPSVSFK